MSAALPGSGHLYLRRPVLGVAELAGGVILFFCSLVSVGRAFLTVLDDGTAPIAILRACIPWVFVLSAYCILDGLFTWVVSRRHVALLTPAATQA